MSPPTADAFVHFLSYVLGAEVLLGIGFVVLLAIWLLARRFEREAADRAAALVGDTERVLSSFDVQVVPEPVARRRRRDGRHRRRRRKRGGGGDQQGGSSS